MTTPRSNKQDQMFGSTVNGSKTSRQKPNDTVRSKATLSVHNAEFGVGIKGTESGRNKSHDLQQGVNSNGYRADGDKSTKTAEKQKGRGDKDTDNQISKQKTYSVKSTNHAERNQLNQTKSGSGPRAETMEPITKEEMRVIDQQKSKSQTQTSKSCESSSSHNQVSSKTVNTPKKGSILRKINEKEKKDGVVSLSDASLSATTEESSVGEIEDKGEKQKDTIKTPVKVDREDSFPSDYRADGRISEFDHNGDPKNTQPTSGASAHSSFSDSVNGQVSADNREQHTTRSLGNSAKTDRYNNKAHNHDNHSEISSHEQRRPTIPPTSGSTTVPYQQGIDMPGLFKVKSSMNNIVDCDVDVIVSSDNPKLEGFGMVAKSITERGGRQLQTFKESVIFMCQGIQAWKFQPTPAAGKLKCKHIFHVVVPPFSEKSQTQWVDNLKSLIKDVLRRTEQFGYKSIAIPIIGSGRNSALPEFIVDLICASIKQYTTSRPQAPFLETIVLVHPDRKIIKHIDKQIKDLQLTGDVKEKSTKKKSNEVHFLDVKKGKNETCPICMEEKSSAKLKELSKCKHIFCKSCLDECFKRAPICPICNTVYGTITGNQPMGTMVEVFIPDASLPGYQECNIIKIFYHFPDGIQEKDHPNPGLPYRGTKRSAYLPDNDEGQKVHRLLRRAFNQRLVFTIGSSRTTGREDVVTWNDIHHKTNVQGGPEKFGYPDPTYLSRVLEELAVKGITED